MLKNHSVRMAGSMYRIKKEMHKNAADSQMVFRPKREKNKLPIKAPRKKTQTI